jgi:hypothetical protein
MRAKPECFPRGTSAEHRSAAEERNGYTELSEVAAHRAIGSGQEVRRDSGERRLTVPFSLSTPFASQLPSCHHTPTLALESNPAFRIAFQRSW